MYYSTDFHIMDSSVSLCLGKGSPGLFDKDTNTNYEDSIFMVSLPSDTLREGYQHEFRGHNQSTEGNKEVAFPTYCLIPTFLLSPFHIDPPISV